MKKCNQCGKRLRIGDEAHVDCVNNNVYCSKECMIVYRTNAIIMNAKELATEEYNEFALLLTVRPTTERTLCKTCGKDLATCETIFAAEGHLYCSRECGIKDYSLTADNTTNYADELFDSLAEEITPEEIGLEVTENEDEAED